MEKVDMSSDAIDRRLRQVEELRVLCLSLMKAKKVPKPNVVTPFSTQPSEPESQAAETHS